MAGVRFFGGGVRVVKGGSQLRQLDQALEGIERLARGGPGAVSTGAKYGGASLGLGSGVGSAVALGVSIAAAEGVIAMTRWLGPIGRGLSMAWAYMELQPAIQMALELEMNGLAALGIDEP